MMLDESEALELIRKDLPSQFEKDIEMDNQPLCHTLKFKFAREVINNDIPKN